MLEWKYRPKEQADPSADQSKQDGIEEQKPEGFVSHHIKTITFLVCVGVFLVLFGPVNIFWFQRQPDVDQVGETVMTEEDLVRLSMSGSLLTMAELQRYRGEVSENEYRVTYTVKFDHYLLLSIADRETGALLFCQLSDSNTHDTVDVLSEDVKAFFDAH